MPKRNPSIAGVIADAAAIRAGGDEAIADAITRLAVLLAVDDRELLKVADAAAILSVHPDTIRRAITSGELPSIRVGPERTGRRVRREDLVTYVQALVEAQRTPPTGQ